MCSLVQESKHFEIGKHSLTFFFFESANKVYTFKIHQIYITVDDDVVDQFKQTVPTTTKFVPYYYISFPVIKLDYIYVQIIHIYILNSPNLLLYCRHEQVVHQETKSDV